ncbi:hypothetical protein Lser_V15G33749 [Lactuca serriola]
MGHQWVKIENRTSIEYVNGVKEFLNVARHTLNSNGLTSYPCSNCLNSRLQNISVITSRLISVGTDESYTRWVHHGKDEVEEEDAPHNDFVNTESAGLRAGLEDAVGHTLFDIGPTNDLISNQKLGNARYEKLHEALNKPLYEGCKSSTLTFVVKLMNLKMMNKWIDNCFEMMLKLLYEDLPDCNNCPESCYDVRMLLCEAGLGYELIDVCQYDCAILYGDNKDAITCPVYQSNCYVRNKITHKKLRYFPITPRLKCLNASRHTAKDMSWHKEVCKDELGVLRHPADGEAWKHFDIMYPNFADDHRSVRLGLASDGFNPFRNMTTSYSMWPVILMSYNMSPWCTMHKRSYFLTLLIPSPKSPGKDFDIFLTPLMEELKVIWGNGVQAYDDHSKSLFTLHVAVIWTISDFPAYAYLSGWCTIGKLACPICLEDTHSRRIHGKNVHDNIVRTLLNDPVKSKDTTNARLDLVDLNIRKDQWLRERNGKFEKPHANFTLTRDECVEFYKFIKSVRLPDGYASNIS